MTSILNSLSKFTGQTPPDEIVAHLNSKGWIKLSEMTRSQHEKLLGKPATLVSHDSRSWYIIQQPPWKFWFDYDWTRTGWDGAWVIQGESNGTYPTPE